MQTITREQRMITSDFGVIWLPAQRSNNRSAGVCYCTLMAILIGIHTKCHSSVDTHVHAPRYQLRSGRSKLRTVVKVNVCNKLQVHMFNESRQYGFE